MRIFGGARVQKLMGTFGIPDDQPIEMKMISRQLESAQTRIEGFHFDARKQVLAYDDILNQQRMITYTRRKKLLFGDTNEVSAVLAELVAQSTAAEEAVAAKKAELGEEVFMQLFQRLSLQMIDTLWVEHLEVMNYTRNSVNLRSYGQRDPLVEYRTEGTRLFAEMQAAVLSRMLEVLPRLVPQIVEKEALALQKQADAVIAGSASKLEQGGVPKQAVASNEPSRNEVVVITNGTETKELKYKKAQEFLALGWTLKN